MKDGYIFEMTLDQDSKLIDVDPVKTSNGLITAVDGKKISIDNEIYFLTDDTSISTMVLLWINWHLMHMFLISMMRIRT